MLTVLTANSQAGGFTIANSLRFRASASAYLNRTPASASNRTTWTWSAWVKRGKLSDYFMVFSGGTVASDTGELSLYFLNNDTFGISGGSTLFKQTTQVFRDPSSWYHIVVAWDTTQATASNRIRLYVNGIQVTSFSTSVDPSLNLNGAINDSVFHTFGEQSRGVAYYFDGYLTEINFIDGQALTPSSFGEIDSTTGVWKAKRYTGTYGTNGFRLNFSNGTSTTTLGYDSSGNGNNWTTNNISLTAGSTYDWMIDSPTPFAGTSYGVGNYCVLMPFTVCNAVSAGWGTSAASDGNLNYSSTGGVSNSWSSFVLPLSGKYYAEMRFSSLTTGSTGVLAYDGNANRSVLFYQNGTIYNNNALSQSLTAWSSGDTIGLAINMDASTIQFYRNGSAVGTAESITVAYGQYFIFNRYQASLEANFGQRPFAYTPPSGYKSLCTQNLPGVTIQNGAQYMAATTYTGNGTSQSIVNTVNGVSFQPNFVWVKSRSLVAGHELVDSVRGAAKTLYSNLTNAEDTTSQTVTAFNSNGFSVGADTGANSNGATQIAWNWKAGGTAVTNTAGSITSSVSANQTAGFSVVTYTGNGTASTQTIGHGLGTTLSMLILKGRASSGDMNWGVSHTSIAAPNYLLLNSTGQADNYGPGQGQPSIGTGNTFKVLVGTTGTTNYNTNGATYVAYCFAAIPGYSAFGSYTGNGSTDGVFVHLGFRPRFVMIKRTDSAGSWVIDDSSRDNYNVAGNTLFPNSSSAESASNVLMDMLSNGFKLRGVNVNDSGATFVYACFAESPFQNALAR